MPSNAVRAHAALDGVQALERYGGVGVGTRGGAGGRVDERASGEALRECGGVYVRDVDAQAHRDP